MSSLCQNIKAEYERLLAREAELLAEMERVKDGGDLSRIKRLLAEMEEAYETLDKKPYIGWTLKGDLNQQKEKMMVAEYHTPARINISFKNN